MVIRTICFLLVLLFASVAEAVTWYVNAAIGHDTNNDCTEAQNPGTPKATINNAFTQCVTLTAGAGANDTVSVASGTYAEVITSWPSGTAGNPFTLISATQHGAIIRPPTVGFIMLQFRGDFVIFDGFVVDGINGNYGTVDFDGGVESVIFRNSEIKNVQKCVDGTSTCMPIAANNAIYCNDATGIQILNNSIHEVGIDIGSAPSTRTHAVYWGGCDNGLVEGNTIYNVSGFGIHLFSANIGIEPNDNIMRNNRIYDYALHGASNGIVLAEGSNNVAYNNVIYQTASNDQSYGASIDFFDYNGSGTGGVGNKLLNNTIYNVANDGISCAFCTSSAGAVIQNNIIIGSAAGSGIILVPPTGNTCSHNLTDQMQDADCTSQISGGNPTFASVGNGDFRLAMGSNGIDDGVSLAGTVDIDFGGTARPQNGTYDVGAYEYTTAPQPPNTWYVNAVTGNNSTNDCMDALSPSTPKATINAGLACVGFGAGAGANSTVYVANGTYAETITTWPSGTAGNPFTLTSTVQHGAIIQPPTVNFIMIQFNTSYVTFDGFVVDAVNGNYGAIDIHTTPVGVTISNSEIKNVQKCVDGTANCDPVNASNGILCSDGSQIQLLNNVVHHIGTDIGSAPATRTHAIYWGGCDNGLVEGNTLYDISGFGVHLFSANIGIEPNNNIIRNNRIYNYALHGASNGIVLAEGSGNIAYNNLMYQTSFNGESYGASVDGFDYNSSGAGGTGNQLLNNTIYNVANDGISCGNCSSSTASVIRNNIVLGSGAGAGIVLIPSTGNTCSHNLTDQMQDVDCTNQIGGGSPTFENIGTGDFRLVIGSNGIDDGVSLAGTVDTDFAGTVRPQNGTYDVGAYEFTVGGGGVPPREVFPSTAVSSLANSGSQDITVPVDTDFVVVCFHQWFDGNPTTITSLALEGVVMTQLFLSDGSASNSMVGCYIGFGPPVGSTTTFAWDVSGIDPASNGNGYVFRFFDTTDTPSSLSQVVVDSDLVIEESGSSGTSEVTVASNAAFGVYGWAVSWTPIENPNGAPGGSGQTIDVNDLVSGVDHATDLFHETTPGASTTALSGSGTFRSVTAIALKNFTSGGLGPPVSYTCDGTGTLPTNWTHTTSYQITNVSNVCRGVPNAVDAPYQVAFETGSFSNDQYSQIVIADDVAGNFIGVCVHCQDPTGNPALNNFPGYFLFCGNTGQPCNLQECSNASPSVCSLLATFTQSATTGDLIKLGVIGTTFYAYKNNVPFTLSSGVMTDSTLTAGKPGIATYNAGAGDNWEGGSFTLTSGSAKRGLMLGVD